MVLSVPQSLTEQRMDFKTRMRWLRAIRGMTQVELAEKTGIPNTLLSRIETGVILPGPDYETKIREALGWDDTADEHMASLATVAETS